MIDGESTDVSMCVWRGYKGDGGSLCPYLQVVVKIFTEAFFQFLFVLIIYLGTRGESDNNAVSAYSDRCERWVRILVVRGSDG